MTDAASADAPSTSGGAPGLSVTFWGVRGSAPVSGAGHHIFGGGTMCLEIRANQHRVIIDAGSGIRQLGRMMQQQKASATDILLTHFHIDHVMGLMTFAPLFQKGASITLHAPILQAGNPEAMLPGLLGAPLFPMSAGEAGARFTIKGFHPGESVSVPGLDIQTTGLSHPGGACGYRVAHGGRSVTIVLDHEHGSPLHEPALVQFCSGSDLILYDAPWDEDMDYEPHRGWGHSTWQAGLRLLRASGARRLGCLHHAPEALDATLLEREALLRKQHAASFFAREGATVHLSDWDRQVQIEAPKRTR
jgi:phosphoribosyl 1,2-cyclic phosphodiesterase